MRQSRIGFLYLILIGDCSHQVFLEVVGPGKSGKSTFQALAMALVGYENTYSSSLATLQNNRFELANIIYKKLVVLPDQPQWAGPVDVLKAMTGQDLLRVEIKMVQGGEPFVFDGLVLITANQ